MTQPTRVYITTSIAYVNAPPHIGYALELIQADVLARYYRQEGAEVFFLTGTDEHGQKNYQTAKAAGQDTQTFINAIAPKFKALTKALNISNDDFIRTSDKKRHHPTAQKFWQALDRAGDLYKKRYQGLYCVGHESFILQKELVTGLCPDHKTRPELIDEENYFFRLSRYQDELKHLIESDRIKIVPANRKHESLNFIDQGLKDISFSRSKKTLPWGVGVPSDPDQVMYVWADALTNYLSAIGYHDNRHIKWWNQADQRVHLIGKDIVRFHALYWPAMLLSAKLPVPTKLLVHGHITVENQKMSKSLGNVVDPFELIKPYGVDPARYFLLRQIPTSDDGDFSWQHFQERYRSDLANDLGNLLQRSLVLIKKHKLVIKPSVKPSPVKVNDLIERFDLAGALDSIWKIVTEANKYVDQQKPWQFELGDSRARQVLTSLYRRLETVAADLKPLLPDTSANMLGQLNSKQPEPLFPR